MATLRNLKSFEKILAAYQLSPKAQKILDSVPLVLLTAPSSSGRNTIIHELVASGSYHFVVSDTTRPPRHNNEELEKNGVHYWFRSEDEVLKDLKLGNYLEAEIIHKQQVSGISIRELERAGKEDKVAITDVDIGGAENILQLKPDVKVLFVLPPSYEEWQRRLKHRGHMSQAEHRRRMETAQQIFITALKRTDISFIINDQLNKAVEHVHEIVFDQQQDQKYQHLAHELIEHLLLETNKFLQPAVAKT